MIFKKTKISGLFQIELGPKIDDRGYLMRIFCEDELKKRGLGFKIVQINQTLTCKTGTIRGMHFQREPKAETKIIQCLRGAVYDVLIDLRPDSPTYGKWWGGELSPENRTILLVPKGLAHGFQTLAPNSEMQYLMSEFYAPEYAGGVRWDDPMFNIEWPLKNPTLSEKDKAWSELKPKL